MFYLLKTHKILPVFAFLALIVILMPLQNAYAVAPPSIVAGGSLTLTTTTVRVCWDITVVDDGVTDDGDFLVDGNAVTHVDADADANCANNDSVTLTLTGGNTFATVDTPAIQLVLNSAVTHAGGNPQNAVININAADGLAPTMDSAAVITSTTIDVTFSEDLFDGGGVVVAGDFTLDQSLTVASIAEVAGVVTITTNEIIPDGTTPTVTLAGAVDDASAATNTLAAGPTVLASTTTVSAAGQGSGCRSDCQAPTLGVNSEGDRFVTNGFTYNGKSTDVESFFTPYPLITANVGVPNQAVFKIYDNYGPQNVKHFSLAFGLGDDQIISQSKAMIELDIDFAGIETVTITDPENALDDVRVRTSTGRCDGGSTTQCLIVTVDHTFRAPLDFNIVSTEVWDNRLNSWQNYYNHGIEVVGESLNPPNEYFGRYEGELIHLIETGKNTTIDADGNTWTFDNRWIKDYIYKGKIEDPISSQGYDRNHVKFNAIMQEQELIASSSFEKYYKTSFSHEPAFSEIDDIKFYEFPDRDKAKQVLEAKMHQEDIRAQKYLEEMFAKIYPSLYSAEYPN